MDSCTIEEVLRPAEIILQEDLESLRRTYSEEERVEFWNKVRSAYKEFMLKCSTKMPKDIVKVIKGKYRLAMLMLAASFKLNGENQDSIIKMFKPEEYQLLIDFEKFKIFDNIDVPTIVEFIKRREGRVYELVKMYYERQYNVLDQRWGPLMGDLLRAFEERYNVRRRKIEEAVIEYVRRHGLIETITEIEEVIKKILETGEFKRKIESELRRKILKEYRVDEMKEKIVLLEREREELLNTLKEIEKSAISGISEVKTLSEELAKARIEKERLAKMYEEVTSRLASVEKELVNARKELEIKEQELKTLMESYKNNAAALEALSTEAESLRTMIRKLSAEVEDYRRLLETVKAEKRMLEERLNEVEEVLKGEHRGRLIMAEEARALAEAYIRRVSYKALTRKRIKLYDPRIGKDVEIKKWDDVTTYMSSLESPMSSKGLMLVKKKGLLFKTKDIVIDVYVKLHEEAFKEKGYDTRPVSLAEVVDILERKSYEAERENYYLILVIASPTGFTRKAIEYVTSEEFHRTFVSRNTTLYLVDLVSGKVHMNTANLAARSNAFIVEAELPEEKIEKIKRYMLSSEAITKAITLTPAEPMLLINDVVEATKINDKGIVRRAIAELENEGWGKMIYVKERNIAAFKYSPKALEKIAFSDKQ